MKCLDVHQGTPVEILHTYLLGQDKYVWHATHSAWETTGKSKEIFHVQLSSSSTDDLSITSLQADFIAQYSNALLGKHFKTLQQLEMFHLYDGLCSSLVFDLWKATGDLGALLYYHEILDMEQYLVSTMILTQIAL